MPHPKWCTPSNDSTVCIRAALLLLAAVTLTACDGSDGGPSGRGESAVDGAAANGPVVGGACAYEPFAFRATVDSALPDGALLVSALDAVPTGGRCHLLQDAGDGHWTVLQGAGTGTPARGDTIEISGEVIVTGTCTPCALGYRLASPGGR